MQYRHEIEHAPAKLAGLLQVSGADYPQFRPILPKISLYFDFLQLFLPLNINVR